MDGGRNEQAWYVAIDGAQHGPLSMVDIERLINQGSISEQDLVWREGMPNWEEAGGLFSFGARRPGMASQPFPEPAEPEPVSEAADAEPPMDVAPAEAVVTDAPVAEPSRKGSTTSTIALIFGVLGIIPAAGLVLSVLGLLLGLIGKGRARRAGNRQGQALGRVAVAVSFVTFIFALAALALAASLLGLIPFGPKVSTATLARYLPPATPLWNYYGVHSCALSGTIEVTPAYIAKDGQKFTTYTVSSTYPLPFGPWVEMARVDLGSDGGQLTFSNFGSGGPGTYVNSELCSSKDG